MHEINAEFLNGDGSINLKAAYAAGRNARAQEARDRVKCALRMIRRMFRAGERPSGALDEPLPSPRPLQDKAA